MSGNVQIWHDDTLSAWCVKFNGSVKHGIADQMLLHGKYPGHIAKDIAKDMAKYVEKEIYEALLGSPAFPYGHVMSTGPHGGHADPNGGYVTGSWNDPDTDVMASINQAAQMVLHGSQSGSFSAFESPQASGVLSTLTKAIPALKTAKSSCPANKNCGAGPYHDKLVTALVQHLNDTHQWTRESIADWLDTLDFDLSFQEPTEEMEGQHPTQFVMDEVQDFAKADHALDAMKYAMMQPLLTDPSAFLKINDIS